VKKKVGKHTITTSKQCICIYSAESRAHYAPEPTWGNFFTVVINKKWKCNKPADIILSYVSFLWSQQHFNSAILSNIQYTLIHTNTCTLSVKSRQKLTPPVKFEMLKSTTKFSPINESRVYLPRRFINEV